MCDQHCVETATKKYGQAFKVTDGPRLPRYCWEGTGIWDTNPLIIRFVTTRVGNIWKLYWCYLLLIAAIGRPQPIKIGAAESQHSSNWFVGGYLWGCLFPWPYSLQAKDVWIGVGFEFQAHYKHERCAGISGGWGWIGVVATLCCFSWFSWYCI